MSRAHDDLVLTMLEQCLEPNRTLEVSPFMDLRRVKKLTTITLDAIEAISGDDGMTQALLRRIIFDCERMMKPKHARRIRR